MFEEEPITYTAEDVLKQYRKTEGARDDPTVSPPDPIKDPTATPEGGYSAEDVLARYKAGHVEPNNDNTIPQSIKSTLYERIQKDLDKRSVNISTVFEDFKRQPKSLQDAVNKANLSDVLQTGLGQTASAFFDVTGEVIMSGLGTAADFAIDLVIPEDTQEDVKNKFIEGVNWATTTEAGQIALEAAQTSQEAYMKWKKDHPVEAIKFESAVDLGMLFAPKVAKGDLLPSPKLTPPAHVQIADAAQKQVNKLKTFFDKRAARKYKEENLESAYEYVMPVKIEESRLSDVSPRSFMRSAKLNPNALEADAIEWTASLRGLKPAKGKLFNYNVINNANKAEAKKLMFYLIQKGKDSNIVIAKDAIKARVKSTFERTMKGEPLANTRDAQGQLSAMLDGVTTLMNKHGTKPADLLRMRQDLDKYLEKKFKFFSKEQPVWLDNLGKDLRNDLNDMINEAMPDDFVKESLRIQHLAFTALKGLAPKAVKDIDSTLHSHGKNLMSILRDRVQTSRIVGLSTIGTAGYSAAMGVLPYLTGAIATFGIGGYALQGLRSPEMAKAISYTLAQTNKAIGLTKDPKMLKELRAGRSTLLELSEIANNGVLALEEEEEEQPPTKPQ